MRPRELTLRGFRSWREEVTFDLRGRRLIGIVGPIGAGKSSILDGVAFALFGKTPRVQRDTKSLINQLSDTAHVQLVFEVDGHTWRVTRALKRKGAGQAKLERLAGDAPGAAVDETVVMDKPVRERIESLLGMDFDTFGRSVLLAQNRFAEFLLATDAPRNAVLKGVFGYERFDAALVASKERVAREEATLAALDQEGARLSEARAALDDARAEHEVAGTRRDHIEGVRPAVEDLDREALAAADRGVAATQQVERLTRAAANLPDAQTLDDAVDTAVHAAGAVVDASSAAEAAEAIRREAEAARDALAERMGDLRVFAELVAQLHAQAAAVQAATAASEEAAGAASAADGELPAAQAKDVAASTELAAAETTLAAATDALSAADEALHLARHHEMASELRGSLVPGDPCPVCAQIVATRPKRSESAGIRQAERARASAHTQYAQAMKSRDGAAAAAARTAAGAAAALTDRDRAAAEAADAAAVMRDAEASLAATQNSLVERLGEGDPNALLDERQREHERAETAARAAADDARTARDALDTIRQRATATANALARIREQLAGSWGALEEHPVEDTDESPKGIRDAYRRVTRLIDDRTVEAKRIRTEVAEAVAAAGARRADLLASIGLPADADVAAASTEAQVHAAQAHERVAILSATVEAGTDLDDRANASRERHAIARRLRDDLQPSRFLAWLLAEERAALAELASIHFEELTDGDYRFSEDDSFRIADVNAGGALRDPDSLSGGETFLASLALALALADMVTRGGGRLDSFFLDEGFGSLDPEHIERAMRGIEHLVRGDGERLVILVSHVAQMHELLEDLIVLDKDEAAGTSRVVSGAAPA